MCRLQTVDNKQKTNIYCEQRKCLKITYVTWAIKLQM